MEMKELIELQGQLRRDIELAKEKGMPTQPAKRKLVAVNKDLAKSKRRDAKANLFDAQLDLF